MNNLLVWIESVHHSFVSTDHVTVHTDKTPEVVNQNLEDL